MNASVSQASRRTSRSRPMNGLLRASALLAMCWAPAWSQATDDAPVAAVWKEHELHFHYRSFLAAQSCASLQNRIVQVLRAVGARDDVQVSLVNCDVRYDSPAVATSNRSRWPADSQASGVGYYRRTEPRQVVDLRIRLSMPAELTPEILAELKADKSRRELITRVTGDPLPMFDDPVQFTAQRQVLTLSRKTAGIEALDCELLDQMAATTFKSLGVRVVRRGYDCDRGRISRIAPTLEVEALVPAMFQGGHAKEAPPPGDDPPDPPGPGETDETPPGRTR